MTFLDNDEPSSSAAVTFVRLDDASGQGAPESSSEPVFSLDQISQLDSALIEGILPEEEADDEGVIAVDVGNVVPVGQTLHDVHQDMETTEDAPVVSILCQFLIVVHRFYGRSSTFETIHFQGE